MPENESCRPPDCFDGDGVSCLPPRNCTQLIVAILDRLDLISRILETKFDIKIQQEGQILAALNQKIDLEEQLLARLATFETNLENRLDALVTLLETKVSLENQIIAILVQILNALGGNPSCSGRCSVNGAASGPTPPDVGALTVQICKDCVLLPASVDYDVTNPQDKSVRRVTSTSITSPPTCTLDGSGTGTITITGTADVRVGVNGTVQQGPFTLTLTVAAFQVTQFRIQALTVDDTVTPTIVNNIVVAKCP